MTDFASIYSLIRPPAAPAPSPSPYEELGGLMQLRAMGDAAQLHGLQRTQLQRALNEEDATAQAYRESGGAPEKLRGLLSERGLYKPAQALEKTMLERREKEGNIAKTDVERRGAAVKYLRDRMAQINPADQASYGAWVDEWKTLYGPDSARGLPAQLTPEAKTQLMAVGDKWLEQNTPKFERVDIGGTVKMVDTNPVTNPGIKTTQFAKTQTPDAVLSSQTTRRGQDMTDERARDGNDAGRVPVGYRRTVDGNLEPIPGGPAGIGKALPQPAVRELGAAGTAVEDTRRLTGSFKDEFGGKTILGDSSNTMGRVFGDKSGQAQWWQDMDALQNRTRHELFGSALTKTELAAWEKTSITPRMDSKQIRENLERRAELEARAASKFARAYEAAGYNKEQIRELLGTAAEYLGQPAPPVSPVRPTRTSSPGPELPPIGSGRPQSSTVHEQQPSRSASTAASAAPRVERMFDSMPDPSALAGRVILNDGVRYRSNGTNWVREAR